MVVTGALLSWLAPATKNASLPHVVFLQGLCQSTLALVPVGVLLPSPVKIAGCMVFANTLAICGMLLVGW